MNKRNLKTRLMKTFRYFLITAAGLSLLGSAMFMCGYVSQAQDRDDGANSRVIVWPSREFRSLQSALDALPDGGVLRIAPGAYQINEALFIRNKQVTIEGAGCDQAPRTGPCGQIERDTSDSGTDTQRGAAVTELIGPRRDRFVEARASVGLFNFEDAGGAIRGLKLSGFDAGIVTRATARGQAAPARALTVQNTCIRDAVRGVALLAPSAFRIVKSRISNVMWNGISAISGPLSQVSGEDIVIEEAANACVVLKGGSHAFFNFSFSLCGKGGGITVTDGGALTLINPIVASNDGPGISVLNNSSATIQRIVEPGGIIAANRFAGIYVDKSTAQVLNVWIIGTLMRADGSWGDGVIAVRSSVVLNGNLIEFSDRAGASNFGGFMSLAFNGFRCNAFDLQGENFDGQNFVFQDGGGTLCGCPLVTDPCIAQSVGLQPPEPATPVE